MSVVAADNLTKIYRIYRSPAERLKEILLRRSFHTDFIALENVSFRMEPGETLGIIGENGAGKSTLLKILAGTIRPTSGNLSTSGRTAALLELGAGFNPELTGEENIYLNAYLMGLTREDIDRRKADVISFAELGDFIGRPVKTYSSGMYVRLAFSIATSVDPDILIIDEALSVGDEYFQKKCIDRMMDFRARGKTILFCSHSMYHVQELCTRTIWLERGRIRKEGETGKVILEYQGHERGKTAALKEKAADMVSSPGSGDGKQVRIVEAKVLNRDNVESGSLKTFEPVTIAFRIRTNSTAANGHIGFAFIRNDEVMCFGTLTSFDGLPPVSLLDGKEYRVRIPSLTLLPGLYSLLLMVADDFAMIPLDSLRTGNFIVEPGRREFGIAMMDHEWMF